MLRQLIKRPLQVRTLSSNSDKLPFSERMKSKKRIISPHVDIYAFPVTAISSITNRITGVGLWGGMLGISFLELSGYNSLELTQEAMSHAEYGIPIKFSLFFPITYHFYGGIRHLIWDTKPELLTNEKVEKSSYFLLSSSLITTSGLIYYL